MEAALKFGHQYDTTAAVEDGLDISDISDIPEPKLDISVPVRLIHAMLPGTELSKFRY